jgi:hypothetical protein
VYIRVYTTIHYFVPARTAGDLLAVIQARRRETGLATGGIDVDGVADRSRCLSATPATASIGVGWPHFVRAGEKIQLGMRRASPSIGACPRIWPT